MPKQNVEINRADPFFDRDATDWQLIDTACGVSFFDYLPPGTAT
jgi:hypothetical protein